MAAWCSSTTETMAWMSPRYKALQNASMAGAACLWEVGIGWLGPACGMRWQGCYFEGLQGTLNMCNVCWLVAMYDVG
jgi:hypothetical protein